MKSNYILANEYIYKYSKEEYNEATECNEVKQYEIVIDNYKKLFNLCIIKHKAYIDDVDDLYYFTMTELKSFYDCEIDEMYIDKFFILKLKELIKEYLDI